jgi:sodium/potassium/calcium exchanger 6
VTHAWRYGLSALLLAGVFALLAFVQAIVWLNLSASGLVQICVVVGVIFGLQPALLGATVLAWGNSVPDLVNNSAMARDGFPSMAVAACFASPLFTLLVGMGGALAYGEWLEPLT